MTGDRTPTGDLRISATPEAHCEAFAYAVLPVVEAETAAKDHEIKRLGSEWVAAHNRATRNRQRAEEAEAKVAALMDERGAEQIDRIQAERDALPEDERARLDAADAPMLRIQLAGMARQVAEAKAEVDRTATAAARDIWVKFGFDTILTWKARAEEAERQRDEALAARCPSCDHPADIHQPEGCWFAVTVGTVGRDLVCPCTVPRPAPDQPEETPQ